LWWRQDRSDAGAPKALIHTALARSATCRRRTSDYAHNETRAGVPGSVSFGEASAVLARAVFKAMFSGADEFGTSMQRVAPRAAGDLRCADRQYSFATARETGGEYGRQRSATGFCCVRHPVSRSTPSR
jgi:hypothetical protein